MKPHVLFWCLAALCLPVCCSADTLYDAVKKGADLYGLQKYEEALTAFVDGQVENPENAQLKFNIAAAKYRMKDYEEALKGFLDVASTARDVRLEEKALYNAGNTLYRQGKLDQAVEYYKKALDLDPSDTEARQNLEFVREEIKRRLNEAKQTQDQQQKQCQNPQQQVGQDNQTTQGQQQNQQDQQDGQQQDQQQAPQSRPGQDQQEQQKQATQPAPDEQNSGEQTAEQGQATGQQDKQAGQQAQTGQPRDMTPEQAEQYLNSVQENRDKLKDGQQRRARPGSGSYSGKDW